MSTLSSLTRRALLPLLVLVGVLSFQGCMMGNAARNTYGNSNAGGASAVMLVNQTNQSINYVYVSSCSSNSWGQDQLGASEVVPSGSSRSFTMTPGCWDLKATLADGREVEERQVYVSAGAARTWTVSN